MCTRHICVHTSLTLLTRNQENQNSRSDQNRSTNKRNKKSEYRKAELDLRYKIKKMVWTVVFVPKESNMGPKIQDLLPHLTDSGDMSTVKTLKHLAR